MTTILQIDSSAKPQGSVTQQLTAYAVKVLTKKDPGAKVIYHDLVKEALPHINGDFLTGESTFIARSDALIAELMAADTIVIGVPMYNFSIPSQLKAWIDHVCRAGKTFNYSPNGPVGLVTGKRAIIVVGAGGAYMNGGAYAAYDHAISYMRVVLGFIGITDVTIVAAEKQAIGADVAAGEVTAALATLEQKLAA